ncbi:MAG: hypothetical protein ACO388_01810 [Saprospiraceae bacterium]|jgi:hypothetical protein
MKIHHSLFILLSIITFTTVQGFSQKGPMGGPRERIKTLKIGYFTEQLELDESTASKFWPIYNQFEDKRMTFQKQLADMRPKGMVNDEEATKIIQQGFEIEEQLLAVKKELSEALSKILTPSKLLVFHQADRDFNMRMVREFRDRSRGGMHGSRNR